MVVPCILLAGLLFGAYKLHYLSPSSVVCNVGSCPLALHESDSGKAFVYSAGARFSVFLDEGRNPERNVRCSPSGVIDRTEESPKAEPPIYAATFEAIATGTCILTDDHFAATIVVE